MYVSMYVCIYVCMYENDEKTVQRAYTPVTSDDDRGYFDLILKVYKSGMYMYMYIFMYKKKNELNQSQNKIEQSLEQNCVKLEQD